jgi:hypothetical protein
MPEPSVEPSPPEAAESRLTVPLEAQEASYLAASERIANRSLSDFFIPMFTKCSRRQNQDEEMSFHPTSLQKQALLREAESFGKNFMEIARADLL